MKTKNNYKVWGIIAAIVIILISGLFFILSQVSNSNNDVPNTPITEAPQPEPALPLEEDIQPLPPEQEEVVNQEDFKLFTGDIDTYEKKEIQSISIDESFTIEEKLKLIAEELAQVKFDGLPIEIQQVEEIDGKKIAIINLIEDKETSKTWMEYLNAGSTGSTITLVTLEESFLQRSFEGEWVDGIKIIYEGKEIEEMDHFPGSQIIYRKK